MSDSRMVNDLLNLGVLEARSSMVFHTYHEITNALKRIELQVLRWMKLNLRDTAGLPLISGFKLPMAPLIRAALRAFYLDAFRHGGNDVVSQLGSHLDVRLPSTAIRVRADLATERLITQIERDLKSEWARNIGNPEQMILQTKRVFHKLI